jgi:hypothetical protein
VLCLCLGKSEFRAPFEAFATCFSPITKGFVVGLGNVFNFAQTVLVHVQNILARLRLRVHICYKSPVPEIIDPVFAKTSPNRSFSMTENERFGLVFANTGSINSDTGGQIFSIETKEALSFGR